ncbi:hypothetical protein PF002_g14911 [Phytophthora fragariae]|uniref:Uncharacterized protein n=1 Tax=Phytophthora fragariae TaxID=53985 RepID=A0A6A3YS96_9STRA|nr:hypothetical protein PF002_g14911 [Phytophthora fragariae]
MEWRSSKRFSNPFKPLDLSPQTTSELETLAEVFVSESIRTYEHFLLDENSQVDDNRWKFMYEKDDKKLHFMMLDRKMLQQEVAFCPRCYREALDAKAVTVASQELLLNDVYGWNERCAYTSGTEISLLDELN